jgi:sugar diacid utilization regulator
MKPVNSLTYETLITCSPFFYSEILGGWVGKQNLLQHVVLNEMPKEKDSLVIIPLSEDSILLVESHLRDNNCSGMVLIACPSYDIPSAITDIANDIQKPLLHLENFSEEEVYKRMKEVFFLYENNLLSMMKNDLTTYWLQLFHEKGLERVVDQFNQFLGHDISLFTENKKPVPLFPNKYSEKDLVSIDWNEQGSTEKRLTAVHNKETFLVCYPISDSNQQHFAYLLYENSCSQTPSTSLLVESIAPTMISWLKQMELIRHVHSKYKDQFLFDILHNNIDSERELMELGLLRGMEFTPNAFALSMNINSHRTIPIDIIKNIQRIMLESRLSEDIIYTTYLNHRIVAIVCPSMQTEHNKSDYNRWIEDVRNQIKYQYPDIDTMIGIGRSYYSNLAIYQSFQESKIALQMEVYGLGSDGIIFYEDIGYVRLLSYIHNDLLKDFSKQYIGNLIDHDREYGTDLVQTLSTYCAQNGDIARCAESLYIHQNTLRQRLKKIEHILNIELHQYTSLVNLILSLKIAQEMNID